MLASDIMTRTLVTVTANDQRPRGGDTARVARPYRAADRGRWPCLDRPSDRNRHPPW